MSPYRKLVRLLLCYFRTCRAFLSFRPTSLTSWEALCSMEYVGSEPDPNVTRLLFVFQFINIVSKSVIRWVKSQEEGQTWSGCEDVNERVKIPERWCLALGSLEAEHEMGIFGKEWSVFRRNLSGSEKSSIEQGKKESKHVVPGEVWSQLDPTGKSKMWISLWLAEACLKGRAQPIDISRWRSSWKPKTILLAEVDSCKPITANTHSPWKKGLHLSKEDMCGHQPWWQK